MYEADAGRYETMPYRRTGRSGLRLPAISLGLWHNFGTDRPLERQRAIVRRAFDLGVTHFDLANNYARRPAPPRPPSAVSSARICCPTATSSSSPPRRGTSCGPARTGSGAPARASSPPSTRA